MGGYAGTARAVHLTRRFFGSLFALPPGAVEQAWVAEVLSEPELDLWRRLPRYDRRHSLRVARMVDTTLSGSPAAGDRRWMVAALLHDVGKLDSRLGVVQRAMATLAGGLAGHEVADAWTEQKGIARRYALYLRHPEIGADRLRLAGSPEEAVAWAATHHDASSREALGFPPEVVAALHAADDD